jgi:group I intron endonuclease
MEYHYLYQIVSLVPDENGVCKIYSGVRTSEVEPEIDDYFGSGRRLKAAVKKHGRDKFIKTVVAKFDTREAAYECETQWLNKLFTKFYGSSWAKFNRQHYNLRLNENSRDGVYASEETRQKMSAGRKGKCAGCENPNFGMPMSDEQKQKISTSSFGKTHSSDTKTKMSENRRCEGNQNFKGITIGQNRTNGAVLVFNGNESMKERGFSSGHISSSISGKLPHYKNFTFIRTTDENYLRQLLAEDNFHDEQSKTIVQNFLK